MQTITQHTVERFDTFSSSNIWKLMTNDRSGNGIGAPAKKYIKQVKYERNLGRAINPERDSRPTSWGKLTERRAFDLLPMDYQLVSKKRLFHPSYPSWSGAPDLISDMVVADAKCPFSLEVFCDKLEALTDLKTYRDNFPEDYWQHISNAILLEANGIPVSHFEAVIYCPYKSELQTIREMASMIDDDNQRNYYWISQASDDELPWLPDGGFYKNINVIRFPVHEGDKEALTERVEVGGKLLIH